MTLREKRSADTKSNIIKSGLKLFQKIGYYNTDIRAISKEAGIGLGTYYNYFKDKLSLYLTIFEIEFNKLSQLVLNNDEMENLIGLTPKEVVRFILRYQLNIHNHTLLFYKEASLLLIHEPQVKELKSRLFRDLISSIKNLFNYLKFPINSPNLDYKLLLINNTIEETIYFILEMSKEEQDIYLTELEDFIFLYLFRQ